MKRRTALQILAPSLFLQPSFAADQKSSSKKGWAGSDAATHKKFGVHWYYSWWQSSDHNPDIEFVPMISNRKNAEETEAFTTVTNNDKIKHLLGYNEPERESQGNLSIEDALKFWPKLQAIAEAKNIPLGSPAPSSDGKGVQWLEEFLRQAKKKKLRVDFIAMHWYRSRDADALATFLKGLTKTHRMPVWLTEFNGWSGTERENYAFLKSALRFLEREKSIERYAYFEPGKGKPHSLFGDEEDGMSRMGIVYRDAGM
jgi:Glycosyl hydrolase catalytic core